MQGHSLLGRQSGSNLTYTSAPATIYNQPLATLGAIPPPYTFMSQSWGGVASSIGVSNTTPQTYTSKAQVGQGAQGFPWAIDTNALPGPPEQPITGQARTVTHITGDVYKIQSVGSASASLTTYKTQPMLCWAGRYQCRDISGPGSLVDSTPWSACFVLTAGECHAASVANEIYINIPEVYNPGYCVEGVSWANIPCVLFGFNAPVGGIRQYEVATNDQTGLNSRWISNSWAAPGRQYTFSHSIVHPSGLWAIQMGTNYVDGFSQTGFLVSLPPWGQSQSQTDFRTVNVQVPAVAAYAEIRFGYNASLQCTAGTWACSTAGTPYSFTTEARTLTACSSGCTIPVTALAGKNLYYEVWTGSASNGSGATKFGETQFLSVN